MPANTCGLGSGAEVAHGCVPAPPAGAPSSPQGVQSPNGASRAKEQPGSKPGALRRRDSDEDSDWDQCSTGNYDLGNEDTSKFSSGDKSAFSTLGEVHAAPVELVRWPPVLQRAMCGPTRPA